MEPLSAKIHDSWNENRNQNITTLGCAWKHTPPQCHVYTVPPNAFTCNCKVLERLWTSLKIKWCVIFFHLQPSPVKKERSPRPQSFCHSSSVSPQEKLSLPGYLGHRDKQRLSYGAFANPVYSTSTETPASPVSEGPTIASKTTGKGIHAFMHDAADKKRAAHVAGKVKHDDRLNRLHVLFFTLTLIAGGGIMCNRLRLTLSDCKTSSHTTTTVCLQTELECGTFGCRFI